MGGFGSKPIVAPRAPTFTPDYSGATFSASEVQRQLAAASQQAQQSVQAATAATTAAVTGTFWWVKWALGALGIVIAVILFALLADYISIKTSGKELTGFGWLEAPSSSGPSPPSQSSMLYISYAHYGTDNTSNFQDVTQHVTSMVVGETTLPAFTVSWSNLGLSADPYPGKAKTLYIQYYVGTSAYVDVSFADGSQTNQLPANASAPAPNAPVAAPPPSLGSRIYNAIFGGSSGDLAPSYHDASSSAVIQGNKAPLSSDSQGGYGMQWWMFVKDWNYGYGKKKSVVKRPDATNSSIMNPHISLHPTDNTLQVSVSVFPASEGGASKSTPAPAGHSGSTDDVFICEVPNIPLQTWFSVSVTVFGRNLDVYIDGKLVKSCFLTGVPKPAVGDIQLTPEGGFSGRICGFYHYPRMLTPADASTFYSQGTSCSSKTESSTASKATGYSVKFGVYDSLGKEIQEYAF